MRTSNSFNSSVHSDLRYHTIVIRSIWKMECIWATFIRGMKSSWVESRRNWKGWRKRKKGKKRNRRFRKCRIADFLWLVEVEMVHLLCRNRRILANIRNKALHCIYRGNRVEMRGKTRVLAIIRRMEISGNTKLQLLLSLPLIIVRLK